MNIFVAHVSTELVICLFMMLLLYIRLMLMSKWMFMYQEYVSVEASQKLGP